MKSFSPFQMPSQWEIWVVEKDKKIYNFCTAKETETKQKRKPDKWEEIFATDTSDKGLILKMYEELIQHNTTTTI